MKFSLRFEHHDADIPFDFENSILEVALKNNVAIDHSCGGSGTCGTCRVFVVKNLDNLPPRNEIELDMSQDRKFSSEERLACQTPPIHGLVVKVSQ